MKPQPYLSKGRLDPWILARKLAETLLHAYPDTLKRVDGMLRARDIKSLASLGEISDEEYLSEDIQRVLHCRQIGALFKKNATLSDSLRCETAARDAFLLGEKRCRITNKRLDHYYFHPDRIPAGLGVEVAKMQKYIAVLLGDLDGSVGDSIESSIRLTSGATEDRTRRRSFPFLKVSGKVKCTPRAVPYIARLARSLIGHDPDDMRFVTTTENAVITVPKNWKTHRTIAKEPTHNTPFQLSLDSLLKRKLKKWGIDLRFQTRNQELARLGSIDGSFATIDLAMASDTLSYNALAYLLPADWFRLFETFRSSEYRASWGKGKYAKFSSMGNGYTFTLETLIFAAACKAVGAKKFSVYGDDIILENELAPRLIKLLNFLGFTTNKEKSFFNPDSRFRESCGCDYYQGRLVTPFYLRECPNIREKSALSHVVNGLVLISWEGPLWAILKKLVKTERLSTVPFQDDTRAGVWITPTQAWRTKKLYTDRNRRRETFGFPVFKGYGQTHKVRKTLGWRSLLLWHISRHCSEKISVASAVKSRSSDILISRVGSSAVDLGGFNSTSEVIIGTRFVHCTKRYSPSRKATPHILLFWSEYLETVID